MSINPLVGVLITLVIYQALPDRAHLKPNGELLVTLAFLVFFWWLILP